MGAAAVLATAAETPPIKKSVMKDLKSLGLRTWSAILAVLSSVSGDHCAEIRD